MDLLRQLVGRPAAHPEQAQDRVRQRAGREIAAGFAATPVPLDALAALGPCPTLHLYALPADDAYLAAQQAYAATHPWFSPVRLEARSHFPMFEVPAGITREIRTFLAGLS
ncbi:hypothetical protein [Actinomycetospora sp. NBRC 106378]|uniref:hypothetical protein n=1 Tax=Actinomycetospora sp. NBRC 106378 TaxID=3032208 RepID=UPI002553A9F8|nr:hypothetical protein [Actinomycetospora sp. NBRC 106378]